MEQLPEFVPILLGLLFSLLLAQVVIFLVASIWQHIPLSIDVFSLSLHLLKLATPDDEERNNIIGDLLEEYSQCPSKLSAYLWLYKQVIKSVLPLAYKAVKSRLASYFGERIR